MLPQIIDIEQQINVYDTIKQKQKQDINAMNKNSQFLLRRQTFLDSYIEQNMEQQFFSFQANSKIISASQQSKNYKNLDNNSINCNNINNQVANIKQNILNKQTITQKQEPQYAKQDFPNPDLSDIPPQLIQACQQIVQSLITKAQLQQYRKTIQQRITPIYLQFCKAYDNLIANIDIAQSINTYSQILVKYWDQQMFFQHFVENHYLCILMNKIREHKYAGDIIKAVFSCFQYLFKGLGLHVMASSQNNRQQQFIYLLVIINKEGFITQKYKIAQSQDWAYYAHFLKLLVRIINQADKAQQIALKKRLDKQQNQIQQISVQFSLSQFSPLKLKTLKSFEYEQIYSKYLSIFFNQRSSDFPILLRLLHFYKWSDTIIQTSVKLCLLQLSNHPNRKLQKYFINFPYVTFYIFYCTKISDNIQKYLALSGMRIASQKQSQKQQMLIQQIEGDIKFMQDYLKVQQKQQNSHEDLSFLSPKANNIDKHLKMYINSFLYYIGRVFYQILSKFITEQNANGIINGIILLIKILRINSILKIKLGFQEMFHKYINCELWEYLKNKREKLDQKYWMFQQCQAMIKQHTQNILYVGDELPSTDSFRTSKTNRSIHQSQIIQVQQMPSKVLKSNLPVSTSSNIKKPKKLLQYSTSMLKTMKSYIPTTNSNWLYYQLKKISEVLGLQIILNKQIQYQFQHLLTNPYYKNTFLYIIDKIQQNHYRGNNKMVLTSKKSLLSRFSSPIRANPLMAGILNIANKGVKHSSGNKNNDSYKKRKKIYEDSSEELMYYYLVLMCSINDPECSNSPQKNNLSLTQKNINLQQLSQLLKITKNCKSLMLVGITYWYIKLIDYQLHQTNNDFMMPIQTNNLNLQNMHQKQKNNEREGQKQKTIALQLLQNYLKTMANIVYYILTEGWQAFLKHVQEIKKIIWNKNSNIQNISNKYCYEQCNRNPNTQFTNDIFRDIECDIVYFVMLRHIFGTRNEIQELAQKMCQDTLDRDIICKEIKIPCRLTNSQGDQVFLIMDGQYIKFITADDVLITKKPLSVNLFNIYYQQNSQQYINNQMNNSPIKSQFKEKNKSNKNAVFQLIDKTMNGQCFTVFFEEIPIQEYAGKEIKWRKKVASEIELNLRTMRLDIEN